MARNLQANIVLGGKLDGSLMKSMSATEKRLKTMKGAMGVVGKVGKTAFRAVGLAAAAAGAGAAKVVKDSVQTGKSFDSAMSQVSATLGLTAQDIQMNIGGAGDTYDALRAKAKEMGKSTIYNATQSAEGLNILAMSGFKAQESIAMIEDVLHLAAAGSMEMSSAASYISGTLKGFNDEAGNSGYYADLMAKGATLANTSVSQLGEAMSDGASGAAAYGQSAESMTISLLRLAEQNEVGSAAGTALAAAYKNLYSPTNQAKQVLDELGVAAYDTSGKARDFNDVTNDLSKALSGYTEEEQAAYKQTIFGIQGLNAYNKMTITGVKKQKEWKKALRGASDGAGEAAKQYETMTDNLEGDLAGLSSAYEGMQLAIFEGLNPSMREFVQAGTEGIQQITDMLETDEFKRFAEDMTNSVLDGIGKMTEAAQQFGEGFGENIDVEGFANAFGGVAEAIGSAFGESGAEASAKDFGAALADGLNGAIPVIEAATPVIGAVASGVKTLADNADVAVPVIAGIAGALVTINGVSGVAGVVNTIGGALGIIGGAGAAAGAGGTAAAGGIGAAGAAAGASAANLLRLGGAVLMIGGGVALAAVGVGILAQSAIALSQAQGAPEILLGIGVGIGVLMGIAAALGPVLTAAAAGILAFGASVALIGVGVAAACAGISLVVSTLAANADGISQIVTAIGDAFNSAVTAIGDAVTQITDAVGRLAESIGGAISGVLDSLAGVFDSIGNAAINAGTGTQMMADAIGQLTSMNVFDMGASLAAAADGIGKMVSSASGAADAAGSMEYLNGLIQSVMNRLTEVGDASTRMQTAAAGAAAAYAALVMSVVALAANSSAVGTALATMSTSAMTAGAGLQSAAPAFMSFGSSAASAAGGVNVATAAIFGAVGALAAMMGGAAAASAAFAALGNSISSSMNRARSTVVSAASSMTSAINAIPSSKSISFSFSTPHIPVPHYSVSGSLDAAHGSVPSVSAWWGAEGGILTKATIFGAGEAGPEAVLPLSKLPGLLGLDERRPAEVFIDIASPTGMLAQAASGASSGYGGTTIEVGGVTFAPQITVSGEDSGDVMSQLRAAREEFFDMFDEWVWEKENQYAPAF